MDPNNSVIKRLWCIKVLLCQLLVTAPDKVGFRKYKFVIFATETMICMICLANAVSKFILVQNFPNHLVNWTSYIGSYLTAVSTNSSRNIQNVDDNLKLFYNYNVFSEKIYGLILILIRNIKAYFSKNKCKIKKKLECNLLPIIL